MHFTKMHGAGNDFIIIDNRAGQIPEERFSELARSLCAPHVSVGADGLMLVGQPECGGDFRMRYFNADGSEGEMCGNGARCICRYGYEHGLCGTLQRVETVSGTVTGERLDATNYRIRLNDPSVFDPARTVLLRGRSYVCSYLELGDPGIPHAVFLRQGWMTEDRDTLRKLGRALRYAGEFPKGANVSFVHFTGPDDLNAITYERGVEDFTLACGTGCGAIVSALAAGRSVSGDRVRVRMPGGMLFVSVDCSGTLPRDIFLDGPTYTVYEAETVLR